MYHKMLFFQIQKGKNFVKIQCGTKLDRLFFNSRKEPDMTRLYAFLKKSPLENNRKILIAALCLLVIAGMAPRIYGLIRLPHEFFHNDGNEYRDISEQLYKGNGFSVTSYRWYEAVPPGRTSDLHTDFSRPPLLPLLGAGLYFLPFDWTVSAKVTTVLLSVICILMTFLLGKEIFSSSTVGFLAAAIYTFYPYSIYHSLCWSSENLFLIFLCASYLFLCRCIRRSFAWKYAALCGAMLALAVLTRPQGIMLFLLFGLCGGIYFLRRKEARISVFRSAAAFGLAGLLVFLPWMIRNQRAAGIPSPLSFYGPYSFSQASSDVSYMTYRYVDTPEYKERTDLAWNTFHDEKVKLLGEKKIYSLVDANPYWKKWAWEYIRENPGKMAFIVWNRVRHCFRAAPNAAAVSNTIVICFRIYFVCFLALFLCGIWFARKNICAMLLLLSPASAVVLAVPFLMILRYRYPFFAPFASIFAAYGLCRLVQCFAERKRRALQTSLENSQTP